MKLKLLIQGLKEHLRLAQPCLILRVDMLGRDATRNLIIELTPFIRTVEPVGQEVISEGYDPDHSPLSCPVYYRTVHRGAERWYCSTFLARRAVVLKNWGEDGLAYCDPALGLAAVQIENNLDSGWSANDEEFGKGVIAEGGAVTFGFDRRGIGIAPRLRYADSQSA